MGPGETATFGGSPEPGSLYFIVSTIKSYGEKVLRTPILIHVVCGLLHQSFRFYRRRFDHLAV